MKTLKNIFLIPFAIIAVILSYPLSLFVFTWNLAQEHAKAMIKYMKEY